MLCGTGHQLTEQAQEAAQEQTQYIELIVTILRCAAAVVETAALVRDSI
jgi:hypothetical protein